MTTGRKTLANDRPEGGYTDPTPGFYLYKEQRDRASMWREEHEATQHAVTPDNPRKTGAIGGAYTWQFTPTAIGTVVKLECSCGDFVDVSDYDDW